MKLKRNNKFFNFNTCFGGAVAFLIILAAVGADFFSPYNPSVISLEEALCAPSRAHILGCDSNGSDVLSILLHGSRLSLRVGVIATVFSLIIGLLIGSVAGYKGGYLDQWLMRILDIIFAFPGIILAIAIAAVMGASEFNIIIILSATGWAAYARLVRGEVRALKEKEFIQAAQSMGLRPWRIVYRHIWPNIMSPVMVMASFGIAGCILTETSLSFLGVGVPPGTPSWGSLLDQGRGHLIEAPHISTFSGLIIAITILAFTLLGEGLREYLDPKT